MTATDLELKRAHKRISGLDDEMLVFGMYGLLANGGRSSSFVVGAQTEELAIYTRVLFGEIASRWIPSEVLVPASIEFFGAEDGDA